MALASQFEKTVPIPGEPDQTITFRGLGHVDLKAARDAMIRDWRISAQAFGELYEIATRPRAEAAPSGPADPINLYDRQTLLDRGVLAWSYPVHLPDRSTDARRQEERLAVLGQLDEKTAEWAARTLLAAAGVENAWGVDDAAIEAAARRVDTDELDPTRPPSFLPSIVS